jgi:hypothetical protein
MCDPLSTVTFVTAFIDLSQDNVYFDNNPLREKTTEKRIEYFRTFAKTGLPIALFVCSKSIHIANQLTDEYKNVKLISVIDLKNTWTYNIISNTNELPLHRDPKKDSFDFLTLMNAKIEFTNYVTYINPFNTTHFAWIDFNVCHILKNTESTLHKLITYTHNKLQFPMLLIPGCWEKQSSDRDFINKIIWRFCGGLFIGDIGSIQDFFNRTLIEFPKFINEYKTLTWEVNYWSWLESKTDWSPQWFYAGHDDTMLSLP